MDKKLKKLSALSLGLLFANLALANDNIRTDTFITAGGTFTDSSVPFEGAGKDVNFNQLSRIGIQYTYTPSHDIPVTFTGQLLARGYSDWDIEAEWALISYRPSSSWMFNFGKIRTSMMMLSQFHDVGVSYVWSTPPEETYGFANIPFTSMTGVELVNTQFMGDWMVRTKIQTGNNNFLVPAFGITVPVQIDRLDQIRLDVNNDTLSLSLGITTVSFTAQELSTLLSDPRVLASLAPLAQFNLSPADLGLADTTHGRVELFDAGFIYDNDLLLVGEVTKRRLSESTFPDYHSGMFTAGYHFNQYTPHITFAYSDTNGTIISQEQKSIILGFNIATSASSLLKFEFKNTEIGDGSISPIPGVPLSVSNVGLFDTLPVEFGGDAIEDSVNKISITYSVVL